MLMIARWINRHQQAVIAYQKEETRVLRGERDHRVDYRHVIWSLVRKPGAFARYRFREDLFPTMTFRLAYDALRLYRGQRADVEYVRVLHLAASTMESQVEAALDELLGREEPFDYAAVRAVVTPAVHRSGNRGLLNLPGGDAVRLA